MSEKLDKLQIDLKAVTDALAQVQRTLAEVRHESQALRKQAEAGAALALEVTALKERLQKISSFMSGQ